MWATAGEMGLVFSGGVWYDIDTKNKILAIILLLTENLPEK